MRDFRQHQAGPWSRPLSRRALARGAGVASMGATVAAHASGARAARAASAATLVQSTPSVDISGTALRILQWQHPVPSSDEWFTTFLNEWGAAAGVAVTVDRVPTAEIPTTFAAEIAAGQGHDIVEHIAPLPQYEESVLDLTGLVAEATARHGAQLEMCRRNAFNPTTGKVYGFTHGYAPGPGNYRLSAWTAIGLDAGPASYDELLTGGTEIWNTLGMLMGVGLAPEIESSLAAQAMIWGFGGAIQDENENITINSPETLAAVETMKSLYENCMTPEVFGWNPATNNRLLGAGQASYILDSIAAYRTTQMQQPAMADDIFFSRPLVGPGGAERALAPGHAVFTAMIPTYAANPATAQEFLLHLVANYQAVSEAGKFYNFPAFPDTFAGLTADGGPLDTDPYGSNPPEKLATLKAATDWTVNWGWPGPTNAMIGEAFDTFVLSEMMARAARGDLSPQDAIIEAETRLNEIAQKWRDEGLMGGG